MSNSLTYKGSGVDIGAGESLVERIKPHCAKTMRPEVLSGLGGFGSLVELPKGYQQPVLVAATDGVGTKLKLALAVNQHDTVGIDLVAMCVNDLIVQGAEPLFFLDYYATAHLLIDIATDVISGIAKGCELAGVALVGGETAEMPGMYSGNDYELAGFAVGVVEKNNILDGSKVQAGDVILGITSSGVHSNGFSLIRKILELKNIDLNAAFNDSTVGKTLLEPTRIYVKSFLKLFKHVDVHALAHITGGGLIENLPRVLPENCQAVIDKNSWERPEIFNWLQAHGNIADKEMLRTFNCGIGMAVIVSEKEKNQAIKLLQQQNEIVYTIGNISQRNKSDASFIFQNS